MDDDNQTPIPPSFVALFVPPGRTRPTQSRAQISERYELCEDMAQMLMEPAQTTLFALGITQGLVLERILGGLLTPDAGLSPAEARWVGTRLAELLGWDPPVADEQTQ